MYSNEGKGAGGHGRRQATARGGDPKAARWRGLSVLIGAVGLELESRG
jgi:hypothetical protein